MTTYLSDVDALGAANFIEIDRKQGIYTLIFQKSIMNINRKQQLNLTTARSGK